MKKLSFILIMILVSGITHAQEDLRLNEKELIRILEKYFKDATQPGIIGFDGKINDNNASRKFKISGDTLYVFFQEERNIMTGMPFRDTTLLPFASIGELRISNQPTGDGSQGLLFQFMIKKEKDPFAKKMKNEGGNAEIDSKQLKNVNTAAGINQRIAGQAAGVSVSSDNSPGGVGRINIRGVNSVFSGTTPLYLLDGVPINNINLINPNDIASVEVLKDVSSTSLYGVRGANGVVKITTKKGSENDIPEDLLIQKDILYSMWVFGPRAKEMKKMKEVTGFRNLINQRIKK
jgi:TonB-dependent SusC/RagA subfamily outer membrane receptor